jgi:hypothetical protein
MRVITLNQTNLERSDLTNSIYTYAFPISRIFKEGDYISVGSLNIFYSFFAISAENRNNTYEYIWYDNLGSATFTVTIPNGTYTIEQLNFQLQQTMINNGHYLVNLQGDYVYYLEFQPNPVKYAFQFNSYPIPTALPAGWSNPSGLTFPAVATTPQLTILANEFQSITGINAGTYPSPVQATNYSKASDFTPHLTPFSSFIIRSSLCRNNLANPNDSIYAFAPEVGFGSIINPENHSLIWNAITPGVYNNFRIQFCDQNFRPLQIRDTSLLLQLVLWIRDEDGDLVE